MILFDCTEAPDARRVRIFLAEKAFSVVLTQVDPLVSGDFPPTPRSAGRDQGAPVLQLDDSTHIDDGFSICRYIEELYPEPPLMGLSPKERAQIDARTRRLEREGLHRVADLFSDVGSASPAAGARRTPARSLGGGSATEASSRLRLFFERLEQFLSEAPFVYGSKLTIADITALCIVDFAAGIGCRIPEASAETERWYREVSSRPSARA